MMQSKYQWSANKITDKEMAVLYEWRKKTQTPINLLLAQAVSVKIFSLPCNSQRKGGMRYEKAKEGKRVFDRG